MAGGFYPNCFSQADFTFVAVVEALISDIRIKGLTCVGKKHLGARVDMNAALGAKGFALTSAPVSISLVAWTRPPTSECKPKRLTPTPTPPWAPRGPRLTPASTRVSCPYLGAYFGYADVDAESK